MRKKDVDIITLGCSKNLVDSERLMGMLKAAGFNPNHDPAAPKAKIAVINTCGFIGDAKEESINMILDYVQAKQAGKISKLYVMGCLSQRYREELQKEIPEVDKFYGKATLWRTYWAEDPNYSIGWKAGDFSKASFDTDLKGISTPLYCFENTFDVEHMTFNNTTRVVVKVTLNGGTDFYTIGNDRKTLYTEEDMKNVVINDLKDQSAFNAWFNTNYSGKTLASTNLNITFEANGTGKIKVKNISITIDAVTKDVDAAIITALNTQLKRMEKYKDGATYYTLRIKHFGDGLTPWNNGEYTTEYFNYTAGSNDVINNCLLTVTEDFNINLGDNDGTNGFILDAGAGVVTKNLNAGNNAYNSAINGGPFKITMGSGSVFKVTNIATLNATKANYGFYVVGTGYAVLDAKKIVKTMTGEANVTYSGKLAVVAEEHFAQGQSGAYDFIRYDDGASANDIFAPGFNEGECGVNIAKTKCNPGFGGGDVYTIRVMGEDLSAREGSDFDFNDVVFDVMWTATGAKIRLVAAGGTLPLTIEGNEVHQKFAEANPGKTIQTDYSKGKLTMINTGENAHQDYEPAVFDVTGNFKDANGNNDANLIKVMVNKGTAENPDWLEMTAQKGKVAAKIGIDPRVDWCNERQDIEERWSNFAKWVRGEVEIFY